MAGTGYSCSEKNIHADYKSEMESSRSTTISSKADKMNRSVKIDMTSHGGLRGVASIVIMMQHVLGDTRYKLDSNGSSMLPLFFMLSGFSMAIVYGRKPLNRNLIYVKYFSNETDDSDSDVKCTINNEEISKTEMKSIDAMEFYQNRFARVMPTYYLCLMLAIPVAFLGCLSWETDNIKGLTGAVIMGVIPVDSLVNFFWEIPVNGPGWTVQTLLFFWLLTPIWLPESQRLSDSALVRSISKWFYVQMLLALILYPVYGLAEAGQFGAIGMSTMSPVSRFPLFLMGIDAGMLCLRHGDAKGCIKNGGRGMPWPNKNRIFKNWFPTILCEPATSPVPSGGESSDVSIPVQSDKSQDHKEEEEQDRWIALANESACSAFISWFFLTVLDSALRLADRDGHDLTVQGINFGAGLYCFLWYQAIDPFVYLTLLVAVTKDGGKSITSMLMRTPLCQFLGKISMAVYLVHMPCIGYLKLMVEGPIWSISSNKYMCWILHGGPLNLPPHSLIAHGNGQGTAYGKFKFEECANLKLLEYNF